MTITNMDNNKGIIPIKLYSARIISGYARLLHVISWNKYEINIDDIKVNINSMNTLIESDLTINILYKYKLQIMKHKFEILTETYNHFRVNTRQKRGLIDGLGTIIHAITGNLDQDDLKDIGQAIDIINRNEDELTDKINEQINVNNLMIDRFSKIQKYVTDQSRIIEYETQQALNNTRISEVVFKLDQQLYQIVYNIEMLQTHLNNIIESITLAKLNIISRHILNKNEVKIIQDIMSQQNILVTSEEDIYNLIGLQAYINQTQIIFSIQIPQIHAYNLTLYQLKQTYINETFIIHIPHEKILLNPELYQYVIKPCIIASNIAYCDTKPLEKVLDHCIPAMINNLKAKCNLIKQHLENNIEEIMPGKIYVSSIEPLEFSSTCNQQQKYIRGQNIINYINCTIQIGNRTFSTTSINSQEVGQLLLPYNEIAIGNIHTAPNITHLEELTLHHEQQLQHLNHHTVQQQIHTKALTIIITITILLISVYVIYKYLAHRRQENERTTPTVSDAPKTKFWRILRGEELRPVDHQPSSTTTTTTHTDQISLSRVG